MTTRWGIAATGGMAAAFSEDLAHVPDAEIAFVGSRSPESAAAFAGRFGATGLGDVRRPAGRRPGRRGGRRLRRDAPPAAPRPRARRDRGRHAAPGREGLHRHPRRCPGGGRRRARRAGVLHGGHVDPLPAGGRARARAGRRAARSATCCSVQADFGAAARLRPDQPALRPRARAAARSSTSASTRSRSPSTSWDARTASRSPGRRTPTAPTARPRSSLSWDDGRAAALTTSLAAQTPGRALLVGTEGSIELMPPFHHPTRVVLHRNGAEPEEVELAPIGRGYAHQAIEVQDVPGRRSAPRAR